MTVQVLHVAERKCSSCEHVVKWETVRTDVPGTKEVTICRCPYCNRQV